MCSHSLLSVTSWSPKNLLWLLCQSRLGRTTILHWGFAGTTRQAAEKLGIWSPWYQNALRVGVWQIFDIIEKYRYSREISISFTSSHTALGARSGLSMNWHFWSPKYFTALAISIIDIQTMPDIGKNCTRVRSIWKTIFFTHPYLCTVPNECRDSSKMRKHLL